MGCRMCSKWPGEPFGRKTADGQSLRLITGINWSATPANPFQRLDEYLNTAHVQDEDPVVVVVHLAIPRPTFRDRGKQALALPHAIETALQESIESVTQPWTKAKLSAYRSHRAHARAIEEFQRHDRAQYPSIKEAAYQLMPASLSGRQWPGTLCRPCPADHVCRPAANPGHDSPRQGRERPQGAVFYPDPGP